MSAVATAAADRSLSDPFDNATVVLLVISSG